jgi:RNA polymerase sigma factor (sigma-70 family)
VLTVDRGASLTQLVSQARAGDQRAWDQIVARFTGLLWAVTRAYRLEPHTAADAVQVTWLRLIESIDNLQEPEALPGWLLTTARRQAGRVARAGGRDVLLDELEGLDADPLDAATSLDTALLTDERDAALWASFSRLGQRCQRLLRVLVAPECPSYSEVATQLGMPIGSIGPTRGRCLAQLRVLLGESGYDFGVDAEGSHSDR